MLLRCGEQILGGVYLNNLKSLLEDSKSRNIFVFDERGEMLNTRVRVASSAGSAGRYFIETHAASSAPSDSTFEDLGIFLKSFGDRFLFAGGYVEEDYFLAIFHKTSKLSLYC